jgi:hypothetical protein
VVSLYALKPLYQRLFRGLAGDWMTPNMATALGVFFALVVAAGVLLGGLPEVDVVGTPERDATSS